MEINDLTVWTIILTNSAFCLLLPRIVTLDWSRVFASEPNSVNK